MADGKIEIDTKINSDGAQKDLNGLSNNLKKFAKGGVAVAGVTAAFKATAKAIKETTQAYNIQAKAEKQLETAAKNNPYLNDQSVKQLKDYASQLQSISTVGDEQLLPLMAQLASAGRTQEEIQKIMSAALDVSASGAMSLEGAVKNLNKSFSGLSGELGESVPAIKQLTTEELKNGKAVDVLAAQYKGMAEETAKATGSSEQLKNAWGDLKEEIGEPIETGILAPFRRGITNIVNETISGIKKLKTAIKDVKDEQDRADRKSKGQSTEEDFIAEYNEEKKRLEDLIQLYKEQMSSEGELSAQEKAEAQRKVQQYTVELGQLKAKNKQIEIQAELEKQRAEDEAKAQAAAEERARIEAEQAEAEKKTADERQAIIDAYNKKQEESIKRRQTESALYKEAYDHQAALNERMAEYVDLVLQLGEDDPFVKGQLDGIKRYAEYIERIGGNFEETKDQLLEFKKEAELTLEDLNSYMQQFDNITQESAELFRQSNQEETDQALGELAKQYNDGLISYEEYEEKKKEINKKAAQEEYKIKMWEWSSSLLTATANIAEGVSKAIAQGGVAGIITGALVSASGAIQLATLTANKPQPPKFATGGIVGGNSYTGDHINAKVNSGEMILNASQQARLWSMANGGSGGGSVVNMPVTIENRNGSNVSTAINKNGLHVIVDNMVNTSMQRGTYTNSMNIANSKAQGARIL